MSTLKVNTIQDASGGNESSAIQIANGRAKAWVRFDGTGTVSITDSFNVSSITDNGTGRYGFDFTNNNMLYDGPRSAPTRVQLNSVENYIAYHLTTLLEQTLLDS